MFISKKWKSNNLKKNDSDQALNAKHCLLEIYECSFDLLDDEIYVRNAVTKAASESGSMLINLTSHKFEPFGVTAAALLAESHICIHTWPENGLAAADVFTCGYDSDPEHACFVLANQFKCKNRLVTTVRRAFQVDKAYIKG
ncbi:MAG: adenosylmethionine decarboxylase [Desulfobacteraceae bacterium]|nr:adenosylmethionine decarboxylase [Desulfobacteraceae bacterium]